jgi:hypothetical protein
MLFSTLELAFIASVCKYNVVVGESIADIKAELPFEIATTEVVEKVH